jgi:hypothetical protein
MKRKLNTSSAILAIALLSVIQQTLTFAQLPPDLVNTPYRVELNIDKIGIDISPTLNGIFFEDIN